MPWGVVSSWTASQAVITASFLGVGAPEAVLVGVVALVVFGPKGLAEAARGLGKTLRSFAPTIQELTSVSRDLKNTLDEELGIDEIRREFASARSAAFAPPEAKPRFPGDGAVSSPSAAELEADNPSLRVITDDIAQSLDPDIERKRAEAAEAAWGGGPPDGALAAAVDVPEDHSAASPSATENGSSAGRYSQSNSAAQPAASAAAATEAPAATSGGGAGSVSLKDMTTDELEAELRRRQAARSG